MQGRQAAAVRPPENQDEGAPPSGPILWAGADAGSSARVFRLTPEERLSRQWKRLGPAGDARRLVVRRDVVIDTPSLGWLLRQDTLGVVDSGGVPLIAWVPADIAGAVAEAMDAGRPAHALAGKSMPAEAISYYSPTLKKRERFLAFSLARTPAGDAERAFYFASYKGVTDAVTKYAWPHPALHVVRACVSLGITPNMVTSLSILLSILAIPLFMAGHVLAGLLAAWVMTFLDTVDGKLARVTVSYTSFGNYFDHVADIVFPPIWWWAFAYGLVETEALDGLSPGTIWLSFAVILGSYVAGRLCEGWFSFRHRFAPFLWRPFDSKLRLVLARRNPNLVLLTLFALFAAPALGYVVVAIWCLVCAGLQLLALVQSEIAAGRAGGKLQPYLEGSHPAA